MTNVLFLFEDALRYDAYYGKDMQPLRDFLGPVAEYFNWYSVSNCSDPNTASMMTGLYPWEHGVRRMGEKLGAIPTFFDMFRDRGYTTIFSGWGRLKVIRGMDWHQSLWTPGHITETRHRITPNLQAMLCCVLVDKPWFAFARHMWCHSQYVNKRYSASVARTATDLIELITWVRNLWPDTMVVITADHGEFFDGPKGKYRGTLDAPATPPNHAWGLFETLVHVPMVVSYPMGDRRALAHAEYYQHTDLADLLLGKAMLPHDRVLMEGTGVDPKYAAYYHRGVVDKDVKFILGGKDGAQDPFLYFSSTKGIDETHNQAQAYPEVVAAMTDWLPPSLTYTPAEAKAVLERLTALGYGD